MWPWSSSAPRDAAGGKPAEKSSSLLGDKRISLLSSICLLTNSTTGAGMPAIPSCYQGAGWIFPTLLFLYTSALCGTVSLYLCKTVQMQAGNAGFAKRIEFVDLARSALPRWAYWLAITLLVFNFQANNVSAIVVSAQAMDATLLAAFDKTCAITLYPFESPLCVHGDTADGTTDSPFGAGRFVLSMGFGIVLLMTLPLSVWKLEENMWVQVASFGLLMAAITMWMVQFFVFGLNWDRLPAVDPTGFPNVVGNVIFNFAAVVTLPSWLNEKAPGVSVTKSVWASVLISTALYLILGFLGGLAIDFPPGQDLIAALNNPTMSGVLVTSKVASCLFPIAALVSGIPIVCIIIRYNLINEGVSPLLAGAFAVVLPWVASLFFYPGNAINTMVNWSSALLFVAVNFTLPLILYVLYSGMPAASAQGYDPTAPFRSPEQAEARLEAAVAEYLPAALLLDGAEEEEEAEAEGAAASSASAPLVPRHGLGLGLGGGSGSQQAPPTAATATAVRAAGHTVAGPSLLLTHDGATAMQRRVARAAAAGQLRIVARRRSADHGDRRNATSDTHSGGGGSSIASWWDEHVPASLATHSHLHRHVAAVAAGGCDEPAEARMAAAAAAAAAAAMSTGSGGGGGGGGVSSIGRERSLSEAGFASPSARSRGRDADLLRVAAAATRTEFSRPVAVPGRGAAAAAATAPAAAASARACLAKEISLSPTLTSPLRAAAAAAAAAAPTVAGAPLVPLVATAPTLAGAAPALVPLVATGLAGAVRAESSLLLLTGAGGGRGGGGGAALLSGSLNAASASASRVGRDVTPLAFSAGGLGGDGLTARLLPDGADEGEEEDRDGAGQPIVTLDADEEGLKLPPELLAAAGNEELFRELPAVLGWCC